MAEALLQADLGRGRVEPNPMVGAVIVKDGAIIARGHHRQFGGPHAEIDALRNLSQASPAGATMYVTLEPCCHRNKKTPPCVEAIIPSGIARVVIAMEDPDANVRGRGVQALQDAGIEVSVGLLRDRAQELLEAYVKLRTQSQPWVICKWAQTSDGYLSLPVMQPGRLVQERCWISCDQSRQDVHVLRGCCDGVLAGIGTVLADNPVLNNRSGSGKQPARVVLDSQLRLPLISKLVQTIKDYPLIIATAEVASPQAQAKAELFRRAGAEVLEMPDAAGRLDLEALLNELGRRKWTRLLVEGGCDVHRSFLERRLADELIVYVAPRRLGAMAEDLPRLEVTQAQTEFNLTMRRRSKLGVDWRLNLIK